MTIKNLFDGDIPYKVLSEDPADIRKDAESLDNINATFKNYNRFIPQVDFGIPENFARYGSAEKYYEDAITRIYGYYPYDGSSKEKQIFLNKSTYIDLWMLDNKYPRTNGYALFSANGWGSVTTSPIASTAFYGEPSTQEYIYFEGGPHTASGGMIGKPLQKTFDDSNIYDEDIYDDVGYAGKGTRESNLKTNFDNGITIEFWFKKEDFTNSNTEKEVIFDLWNNITSSATSYGRVLLQVTGTAGSSPFTLSVQSGTAGFTEQPFGSTLTTASFESFGHYAFRIYNSGSSLVTDFYVNGEPTETALTGNLNEIDGALNAQIGALTSPAFSGSGEFADRGWGKLSGSIDEFRFWKETRTSEDIGRYWFTQVYGGTNTDISNAALGVYYKFNEGITGDSSIDSTALDYSGRISNGTWTGYTSDSRTTASAIVEAGAAVTEFLDPIIHSTNPLVQAVLTEMKNSGSVHDFQNNAQIYNSIPTWIIEADDEEGGTLKNLAQIMSSYFDTLHLQIEQLPRLKDITYVSGTNEENIFADELLEGSGFVAPEIFADASVLNQIFSRNEIEHFEEELYKTKNLIYKNIYNNLLYIYKSKGTEKSFRNLIRCYGVDNELIKLNLYTNNLSYEIENKLRFDTAKERYADFYSPSNFGATVYQQTASGDSNSISFISASSADLEKYTSFTLEIDIIFPKKRDPAREDYFLTSFNTSSLFGFHSADPTTPTDFTWPGTDYDLSVYAVRPDDNDNQKDAYFLLTSSFFGIELQTDTYADVYENKKWHFTAKVIPEKTHCNLASGTLDTTYRVEFAGINTDIDIVREKFVLTSSISDDSYLTIPKRLYMGSHRTNFTGSLIHQTDIKASFYRYWMKYLGDSEIKSHAIDIQNTGIANPAENAYNFVTSLTGTYIPNKKMLALSWNWNQISSSDASGQYLVKDLSSGSAELTSEYRWIGETVGRIHPGKGDFYNADDSSVINVEYIPIGRSLDPEILNPAYDLVKILTPAEDNAFTRQRRPVNFYYSIEKSMYQTISENMMQYLSSVVDFSNLFGQPVDRYRTSYKNLDKLRNLFFEGIENEPDIERYIEYYKWVDSSLSEMLKELIPASSNISDGIRTIVESHVLERNQYRYKLAELGTPAYMDDLTATIESVALLVEWKFGTPTLPSSPPPTNEHCYWWKYRADRTNPEITSGDAAVDADRNMILSASISALTRTQSRPVKFLMNLEPALRGGLTSNNNNIITNVKSSIQFGNSAGIIIAESEVKEFKDCQDVFKPNLKQKFSFEAENRDDKEGYATGEGDLLVPFIAVSSSVITGYNKEINTNFKPGFGVTNLHIDSYENYEVPMQGPFTEKWVGGNQHRHVPLNQGTDSRTNRPEAWALTFPTSPVSMKFVYQPPTIPRAVFYRDLIAKRPVNIKNIKDNTTTGELGNYSKDYEIVQTCGRTTNNSAFIKAGGFEVVNIPSPYVAGMDDYAKPQRGRSAWVFVNRFSSPGSPDTAGDSNGGPALDPEAAEYSPYNNINYRNTTVRDPYRLLLASHVNQFGYYSDVFGIGNGPSVVNSLNYAGTASIYQVNRNPVRQMKDSGSTSLTASVYDNFYVQHPIPRTDMQYAWITASALSYDTFGYLPYSGEVSSSSGPISLVTFSSASDYVSIYYQQNYFGPTASINIHLFGFDKNSLPVLGTGGSYSFTSSYYIPTVYNWLNYNVYEPLEYSSSFIGYRPSVANISDYVNSALIPDGFTNQDAFDYDAGPAALLNAILLKRNGPYQHPSWKQIRGNEHPLVRYWNSHGKTAYNLPGGTLYSDPFGNVKMPENGAFKILKDPAVISKYKPLGHGLKIAKIQESEGYPPFYTLETSKLRSSYGNMLTYFANKEISKDNYLTEDGSRLPYVGIFEMYSENALNDNISPVREFGYLSYSEQVYPSSINCYSKENRERVGYQNTFWKDSRLERTTLGESKFGGDNSQGTLYPDSSASSSQSSWALDARDNFSTSPHLTAIDYSSGSEGAGELQNDYTTVNNSFTDSVLSLIQASPFYNRKHTMGTTGSVVGITGMEAIASNVGSPTYLWLEEASGIWGPICAPPLIMSTYSNSAGYISVFGGSAKFEADKFAGYVEDGVFISASATPFYDKYEQYNLNMRLKNKDMSLIPEFRIGDHIQKYLTDSNGFVSENAASFSIFGADSSLAPQNSSEDNFYRIYSFSDFMEYFEVFDEDHKEFGVPQTLTLSCKALMKFIPYDGFYPAERTLEIAQAFSQSYGDHILGKVPLHRSRRSLYAPLFSPGILFNTIKSGVAVDYPVLSAENAGVFDFRQRVVEATGTTGGGEFTNYTVSNTDYYGIGTIFSLNPAKRGRWNTRIPFEALLEPERIYNINFVPMEPHPSCSVNTLYSASLGDSAPANNRYKLMISNFTSETINFFLKDGLTKISTESRDADAATFKYPTKVGSYYGLRIKMRRSLNKAREFNYPSWAPFETPQDPDPRLGSGSEGIYSGSATGVYETMTMYSRPSAFGPPVLAGRAINGYSAAGFGGDWTIQAPWKDSTSGYNPSFTPPYYSGEAWADIIFQATTDTMTLDDIFATASVKYWRIDPGGPTTTATASLWNPGSNIDSFALGTYLMQDSNANDNSMQLSASINIFNKEYTESSAAPVWTIQTKFETPILNFNDKTERGLNFDNITLPAPAGCGPFAPPGAGGPPWEGWGGQTTTPIGMWHQFGLVPEEKEGIYLEIGDIPKDWLDNRAVDSDISSSYNASASAGPLFPRPGTRTGKMESLAELVNFGTQSKKLGQLKDSKTVYEAIVAVPFIENPVKTRSKVKNPSIDIRNDKRLFFEIPEGMINYSLRILGEELDLSRAFELQANDSIIDMVDKVKNKYVFPPQFDFIRNSKAKPVSMYIFEFEHTFDKNDLSYMWQNLSPKFGTKFKESSATLSHPMIKGELLEDLKDKVQWMVFKVKQRANTNYYSNVVGGPTVEETEFGYNWPYDYFSMVEFAKIDATVDFGKTLDEPMETLLTASQVPLPPTYGDAMSYTNTRTSKENRDSETDVESRVQADVKKKIRDID